MIIRSLTIMLALATITPPLQAGVGDFLSTSFKKSTEKQAPSMRVLIAMDKEAVQVEVDGPFKGYDPRTGELLLVSKLGKKAPLQVIGGGLKWNEEFPGTHQFSIIPTDKNTRILVDGKQYRGTLFFYDVEGKICSVNKVPLEEYLTSTLTAVYQKNEPEELFAAIAIAARTNAYYIVEKSTNPYWDVKGWEVGYRGAVDSSTSPAINQAIANTRHMVLSKITSHGSPLSPFYGLWKGEDHRPDNPGSAIEGKISINEAKAFVESGANAAQILEKAFPQTSIQLTYQAIRKGL